MSRSSASSTWAAIPFHEPIPLITSIVVIIGARRGRASGSPDQGWWPFLWHEYITSTDHKRIGIMYIVLGLVMLVRGFADAIMMRAQQSLADRRRARAISRPSITTRSSPRTARS